MKHLYTLMGFAALIASASTIVLHSLPALAGPPEELNAYNFPVSKVVGIPGSCRMIQTGTNPEKEAECAEWGRKFKEKSQRTSSSSRSPVSTRSSYSRVGNRMPIQNLSCYTTGGVYSNLGNCR